LKETSGKEIRLLVIALFLVKTWYWKIKKQSAVARCSANVEFHALKGYVSYYG